MPFVIEPSVEPRYSVERGDLARDRETVLGIWRGNLGRDAEMLAKFDWFYRDCPFGHPELVLLRHSSDHLAVGVAAIGPRRMQWRSRGIAAGVLVDLAVSVGHRSLGPALMLERELARLGSARFDFLYGFPNAKAVPLLKRLGIYRELGSMVRYARVVRYRHYIARRLPSALAVPVAGLIDLTRRMSGWLRAFGTRPLVATWGDGSDARIDALWNRSAPDDDLVTVRDSTFLQWRFGVSHADTRFLLLSDPRNQLLLAWFACQSRDRVMHVRDFWSDDAANGMGRPYIDALLHAAHQSGAAAVSFEFAGAEAKLHGWRSAGFVERSRRPVYGKWTSGEADPTANLYLTAADEDE